MTNPSAEVLGWMYLVYCDRLDSHNMLASNEAREAIFKCCLVPRNCAIVEVREVCKATILASVKCSA